MCYFCLCSAENVLLSTLLYVCEIKSACMLQMVGCRRSYNRRPAADEATADSSRRTVAHNAQLMEEFL